MDILTTKGLSPAQIEARIANAETCYPSLKGENERIRRLAKRQDVQDALAAAGAEIDAALVSTCRSDVLSCGRCAFWTAFRTAGLVEA